MDHRASQIPMKQLCQELSGCIHSLKQTTASGEPWCDDIDRLEESTREIAEQLKSYYAAATPQRKIIHDIRNNLGHIIGYSELLLEELDTAPQVELLQNTLNLSHRILNILCPPQSPRNKPSESNHKPAEQSSIASTARIPGKVLVVDDDERNIELLTRYLNQNDHETLTAMSGEDALALLKDQEVDLILLDLIMPGTSGYEVLTSIKSAENTRGIPVIMVSGMQDTEGVIRCIEAGADDYLHKPFDPTLLNARINACLERKRWLDREQAYRDELERSHEFIKQIFGRYLSDEIVAQLLEKPEGLNLGGERRKVTILLTDIREFTPLCEALSPERVVTLLNNYLSHIAEIIQTWGGTIDEIQGDSILALFGAPIAQSDDSERAIRCALEMQQAMQEINAKNLAMDLPPIRMGIAINTGEVIVGNIGSERRSKYAVVGHHVNLTARIESFSQGDDILVSENTLLDCKASVSIKNSFSVRPKGVSEKVNIHQVSGISPNKSAT